MGLPITIEQRISQQLERPPSEVAPWLFYQGFSPSKRLLARLINRCAPAAFTHDRMVIADLCSARNRQEVDDAIALLHRAPAYEHAFVRGTLGCRLSGRRLAALASRLLGPPAT